MAIVQRRTANTPKSIQPVFFSDFTTNFEITQVKKDLFSETNEEAVKTSIRNLLLTNRGDRLFNNTLGSDVRAMLFENPDPAIDQIIADYVTKTIENYEPRAGITDVNVNTEFDAQYVTVTIVFNIINKQEPVTLNVVLNRIR